MSPAIWSAQIKSMNLISWWGSSQSFSRWRIAATAFAQCRGVGSTALDGGARAALRALLTWVSEADMSWSAAAPLDGQEHLMDGRVGVTGSSQARLRGGVTLGDVVSWKWVSWMKVKIKNQREHTSASELFTDGPSGLEGAGLPEFSFSILVGW